MSLAGIVSSHTLRINHVNKLVSHYQNSPTMCNAEKRELAVDRGWKSRLPAGPAASQWNRVACHEATACLLTLACHCWSSRVGLLLEQHLKHKNDVKTCAVHQELYAGPHDCVDVGIMNNETAWYSITKTLEILLIIRAWIIN